MKNKPARHSNPWTMAIALNAIVLGMPLLFNAAPALANEPFPTNEQDPVFGGQDFDPIDIIHDANLGRGQTADEFREQTNENLDEASQDFRQQQRERLRELQQQQQNSEPEATPE
ncbi:MAG: hypothetical protein F6J87_17955 [Spirulina sp. SIO3F2]|nr:hypothetical protein [Spirulina sp. SIO3F2]